MDIYVLKTNFGSCNEDDFNIVLGVYDSLKKLDIAMKALIKKINKDTNIINEKNFEYDTFCLNAIEY